VERCIKATWTAQGVYHINAVDEVTQCSGGRVPQISEAWLNPC